MSVATIINGDARRLPLADGSVHCMITSPPYFGLRDYGTAAWEGGDPGCDHVMPIEKHGGINGFQTNNMGSLTSQYRDRCRKCGARRVDRQIGREATPDEFVATMVQVFREVKRVLRDDGTAWVNLGDSYSSSPSNQNMTGERNIGQRPGKLAGTHKSCVALAEVGRQDRSIYGLGSKQLLMMPHRVALALQADGWIVRSDIVWAKPNPMPESVTDRPTKSHEYVFLMSKRERYFWDAESVREKQIGDIRGREPCVAAKMEGTVPGIDGSSNEQRMKTHRSHVEIPGGRNIRSVWSIPTESWPGSHFATFPRRLVEPCVKAGTSEKGCCPKCGAGWERETEVDRWSERERRRGTARGWQGLPGRDTEGGQNGLHNMNGQTSGRTVQTLGWRPSCSCFGHFEEIDDDPDNPYVKPRRVYVPDGPQPDPIPCTVLDPFAGSGTTGVVATGLNRRFVGVELSPEYCRMAVRRISRPHASQRTARDTGDLPLFAGVE